MSQCIVEVEQISVDSIASGPMDDPNVSSSTATASASATVPSNTRHKVYWGICDKSWSNFLNLKYLLHGIHASKTSKKSTFVRSSFLIVVGSPSPYIKTVRQPGPPESSAPIRSPSVVVKLTSSYQDLDLPRVFLHESGSLTGRHRLHRAGCQPGWLGHRGRQKPQKAAKGYPEGPHG